MQHVTAKLLAMVVLASGAFVAAAHAEPSDFDAELLAVQRAWAVATYDTPEDDQDTAYEAVSKQAEELASRFPDRAEPHVWQGIVKSTWAGARGGLGALSLARESREALEAAERIDPTALEGSVYTSLGALYHGVPGWPISFGSDEKAREYLEKAIAQNPDGIDTNYFYGSFLADEGEPRLARVHLERALAAPPRPGREIADAGRREEIRQRLAELDDD